MLHIGDTVQSSGHLTKMLLNITSELPKIEQSKQYTIDLLLRMGMEWARTHPDVPEMTINRISQPFGGPFSPSSSHRDGFDVDIRPMRNDGVYDGVTWRDDEYSQDLTRDLFDVIKRVAGPSHVQYIFFNDPDLINEGVARYSSNHDNHFHVRFRP
jgi:murein endopeptidase